MRRRHGLLILAILLNACSTVTEELHYQWKTSELQDSQEAADQIYGLNPNQDAYRESLRRWPWLRGAALQRRAWILALGPSEADFKVLDSEFSEASDLKILQRLKNQTPQFEMKITRRN